MIYLDNAATSLHRPACVVQAVTEALNGLGNCGRGAHSASLAAGRTIPEVRSRIDRLFHGYGPAQVDLTVNSPAAPTPAPSSLLAGPAAPPPTPPKSSPHPPTGRKPPPLSGQAPPVLKMAGRLDSILYYAPLDFATPFRGFSGCGEKIDRLFSLPMLY